MNQPTQSTDKSVEAIFDIFHKHQGWMANLHMEATVKEVVTHQLRLAELRGRIDLCNEIIRFAGKNQNIGVVAGYIGGTIAQDQAELHDLEEEGKC